MVFRYYSPLRPVAPGTFPNCGTIKRIENFDEKTMIPSIRRRVWGYIEYEKPLTAEDIAAYELIPENDSYEDKKKICVSLLMLIGNTNDGNDLIALEYDADHEIVKATYYTGEKYREHTINVKGDSGFAMIKKIVNSVWIA